jgi:hypothetical protein
MLGSAESASKHPGQSTTIPRKTTRLWIEADEPSSYAPSLEDDEFEDALLKVMGPHIEKYFYSKVVGITFRNADGSIRESLVGTVERFEFVELIWERENPYDANAIAVHKEGGPQLGYLNRRTAEEVVRSIRKNQAVWLACVKWAQPRTRNKHACLVVCLMKMTEQWAKAHTPCRPDVDQDSRLLTKT